MKHLIQVKNTVYEVLSVVEDTNKGTITVSYQEYLDEEPLGGSSRVRKLVVNDRTSIGTSIRVKELK